MLCLNTERVFFGVIMNKYSLMIIVLLCIFSSFYVCFAEKDIWDQETQERMKEFDIIMAEIKGLPDAIDEDLCAKDMTSYKQHMTQLAQKIIDANMLLDDVKTVYPLDLWSVYNTISANPVCGIGKKANSIFGVADISRTSNEERMGMLENDDLCPCWNIITGREELTGFYKDGACRCIYGKNNHNPNIGIIKEP